MYRAAAANKRNTVIIIFVFLLIIGGLGALAGWIYQDYIITVFVVGVAAVYAFIQFFLASRIAMAVNGGREIEKRDAPEFYNVVENLAITAGLPTPRVFIIDDPAPNAFATGRNPKSSMVAATTGLIETMNKRELTAVMAHEMSHVQNYDIMVNMIVFGLVAAIGMITDLILRMTLFGGRDRDREQSPVVLIVGLVALILAPIVALAVQMAVSRQREYLADMSGTLLDRDPEAMISALNKLKSASRPMQKPNSATSHMFFANPLKAGFFSKLFSTHPPLDERIARLQKNAEKM